MAEESFNFDTHFSSSSVASAVSTGCGASKNHNLYSQASFTGTTVSCMTTDSDVYITHEDQTCFSSIGTRKDTINQWRRQDFSSGGGPIWSGKKKKNVFAKRAG